MSATPLHFYSDPGHGWLRVPTSALTTLGIADQISTYSYVHPSGNWVYLEEDRDAPLFLQTLDAKGLVRPAIREHCEASTDSSIRRMVRYSPRRITDPAPAPGVVVTIGGWDYLLIGRDMTRRGRVKGWYAVARGAQQYFFVRNVDVMRAARRIPAAAGVTAS